MDNNRIENAIRPIAVGKKNWLFAGSALAGVRAASIQTLLGTARMNGPNPLLLTKLHRQQKMSCRKSVQQEPGLIAHY